MHPVFTKWNEHVSKYHTMSHAPTAIPILQNDPKTINAWTMYDWANSAYALVIVSAIFPPYFNTISKSEGTSLVHYLGFHIENTAAYSINLGIAFGIVALMSPLLSSISDYSGNQRTFMKFFCYMGAMGCMMLYFFTDVHLVPLGLAGMMLATIGYSGSIVFYNSYLPAIASEDQQDRVSARGFAFGYMGATTLLLINLIFIMNQKAFGVTDDTFFARLSFLLTGLWWFGFAQIPLYRLPKGLHPVRSEGKHLLHGYEELLKIWHRLKSLHTLRYFLFSFFFFIMGLQTIMFMASSFGEKEVHLKLKDLIITVLLLEYLGIAGAFFFAWLSRKISNLHALKVAVFIWILICIGSYFIQTPLHFYTAAFFIGLVMGGIQSLSRSTYAKMIPQTGNNAGYFSFYDVCEKTAMMSGLILFGSLNNLTGSMRSSIVALVLFFSIGFILLIVVDRTKSTRPIQES